MDLRQNRRAEYAEDLNGGPVQEEAAAENQRGSERFAAKGRPNSSRRMLFVIDPVTRCYLAGSFFLAGVTKMLHVLVHQELGALLQTTRHEENDDCRERRKDEASLPTYTRQQQSREACGDERADRPATLYQAINEAFALVQSRVVGRSVKFVQIRGIDRLFCIPETRKRADQNQGPAPERSADHSEPGADRRACDGEQEAVLASCLVENWPNYKRDQSSSSGNQRCYFACSAASHL
ncbi:conserved hypothetical protein [Ricinus communis]|uniref:Uncharacterized protein n=1 Tax=Ricinus communis TaxID=3988 RepID=B9TN71_RICCO|nr:conserved hypothetical protein [Ricinus communis]